MTRRAGRPLGSQRAGEHAFRPLPRLRDAPGPLLRCPSAARALAAAWLALVELDREIRQMEVELRVKALVASNSSVGVLRRAGIRKRIPVWEASPPGGLREGAPE